MFQQFNLFPHLTVLQNITLAPIKVKGQTHVEANSNAIKLLNLFQNELPSGLEAFELMPRTFWEVAANTIENIVLPLSPICTIYTVKFLNQWRKIVLKFVKKNVVVDDIDVPGLVFITFLTSLFASI